MKKIPLSNSSRFALVDDEDYHKVFMRRWGLNKGYARTTIGGKRVLMHNVIMPSPGEGKTPDHKDQNGLNNQKENLRPANQSLQLHNTRLKENNTSGERGVHWAEKDKKWMARIRINGKRIYLGSFDSKEEASKAYRERLKNWEELEGVEL